MRRHGFGWLVAACVLAGSCSRAVDRPLDEPDSDLDGRDLVLEPKTCSGATAEDTFDLRSAVPQWASDAEGCPDAPAREREASPERDASQCPENAEISFSQSDDDESLHFELHCGGWLDHCDVDNPDAPHLWIGSFWESTEHEGVIDTRDYPIELAQASAVWRVAQQNRWPTWESCSAEGASPRWYVVIDDGDMGVVGVSCDGHLPSAWRGTLDSLESVNLEARKVWRGYLRGRE